MPGGDFPYDGVEALIADLRRGYPFLTDSWARRLVRAYGTEARDVLGKAANTTDLGRDFGATLTEAEVRWLMTQEYAQSAEDVLWRRSKLGLRFDQNQVAVLEEWIASHSQEMMRAAE